MATKRAKRGRRIVIAMIAVTVLLAGWVGLRSSRLFSPNRELRIAAGTQGSVVNKLGASLADCFNGHLEGTHVTVVEGADTRESVQTLLDNQAELAVAFSDSAADGEVRTLVPLYELYLYIIVWEDLGIEEVPDLVGRNVGVGPEGSGTDEVARNLFGHYDIKPDDLTLINDGYRNTTNAFLERKLDAVLVLGSTESNAVESMLRAPGAKLLSLDVPGRVAPAMDGIRTTHPYVLSHIIPRHLFGNKPSEPTGVIGVHALLVARADLDEDLAREITRAVFEHKVELGRDLPRLRELTEAFEPQLLRFPLHPGASQYYRRDEPPVIFAWAETISLMITVVLLGWSAVAAVTARQRARRKTLLDELFDEFNKVVLSYDEEDETPPDQMTDTELQKIRERLQALRRRSFAALMSGEVEPNNAYVVFNDYLRYELQEIERIQRDRRRDPDAPMSLRGV